LIEEAVILRDENNLKGLVNTVKRFHHSGLFHQDLHAGNFLWDGDSFFLVDLHRARILSSLSINRRLWNLSHLFHSLRSIWEERDHSGFLETYFEGEPLSPQTKEEYLRKIHIRMDCLQKRQWRSRTRRCLKDSTEFSVEKETGRTIYHRKEFSLDRLNQAIEDHLSILQKNPTLLVKQSPEVVVSLSKDGKDNICVKQFRHSGLWDSLKEHLRTSKGLNAWISGNGLKSREIASIKTLALVEKRRGWIWRERFLIMETPKDVLEMDRYILKGFDNLKEKRLFIKNFAQWLFHLHQKNLYHQDMKSCNILVSKERGNWDFKLLDLEDVILDTKIDEKKLFKNLLQLNTSIPRTVTRPDRLRFFHEYLRIHPIIKNERSFICRLTKKSRERGVVYVSPQGVVQEEHH